MRCGAGFDVERITQTAAARFLLQLFIGNGSRLCLQGSCPRRIADRQGFRLAVINRTDGMSGVMARVTMPGALSFT